MAEQSQPSNLGPVMIGLMFLGLSFIISAWLVTGTWKETKKASDVITVTGSAKQLFNSDLGVLSASLVATAGTQEQAFRELQRQRPLLLAFFREKGVPEVAIQPQAPYVQSVEEYINGNPTGRILSHTYYQNFRIELQDVALVERLAVDLAGLIEQGVNIRTYQPEYYYTKIADVKIEIQAAAAKDAAERAARIAEATGSKLGTMRTARMGVLQITPPNSNQVSDYGMNDVSSIEKEITAVVSASFEIE